MAKPLEDRRSESQKLHLSPVSRFARNRMLKGFALSQFHFLKSLFKENLYSR